MKLTRIQGTNIQGLNFDYQLSDMTAFIGTNFAGKTAILNAIRFALLGYIPKLGKRAKDTFGISSGREMKVIADFDNGKQIKRSLRLEGNSIKSSDEIPPELEQCGQLAVMLDPGSYFGKTDTERVSYVFENIRMDMSQFTHSSIMGRLGKLPAVLAQERPGELGILDRFPTGEDSSIQAWLDALIEFIDKEAKSARAYAERMQDTTRGISGLKAAEGPADPAESPDKLSQEETHIAEQLSIAQASYAALMNRQKEVQRLGARRLNLETNIRNTETAQKKLDGFKADRVSAQAELTAIPANASDEVVTSSLAHDRARGDVSRMGDLISRKHTEERALRTSLENICKQSSCPYCGATGEGWKGIKTDELNESIRVVLQEIEELKHREADLKDLAAIKGTAMSAAKANASRAEIISKRIKDLDSDISTYESTLAKVGAWREELATMPVDSSGLDASIDEATKVSNGFHARATDIRNRIKIAMGKQNDAKRTAEAEVQRDRAKVDLVAAKAAQEELKAIKEEMVEAAFKPLLDMANSIFGSILKTPLAYHDSQIGTWRDGVWVSHKTFSGVEEALAYAAIQAALTQGSPVKIMLIDEMGRFHLDNINAFVLASTEAIAIGQIDQVICVDTARSDSYELSANYNGKKVEADVIELK